MSPATIIADALRSIPAPVRKGMLALFALAVVAVEIANAVEAGWDFEKIYRVEAIVGGYLGVQSAANVSKERELPPGDAGIMAEE